MTKLFGEFLIEQKTVSSEQVLEAVMMQLRSMPSTAEVIFENNFLSADDLLRILGHQQQFGSDFRSSAQTLNLWNKDLATKINDVIKNRRRPLGEMLVSLGYLSNETLAHALDTYIEFMSVAPKNALAPSSAAPIPSPPVAKEPVAEVVLQAHLDPALIKEFISYFRDRAGPTLVDLARQTEPRGISADAIKGIISKANHEIIGIRAAASFLGAPYCLAIAARLLTTFQTLVAKSVIVESEVLGDLLKTSFHVFDGMAEVLSEFQREDEFLTDSNLKDLEQRLNKIQQRVLAV